MKKPASPAKQAMAAIGGPPGADIETMTPIGPLATSDVPTPRIDRYPVESAPRINYDATIRRVTPR